jgi:hypothetical protein
MARQETMQDLDKPVSGVFQTGEGSRRREPSESETWLI